MGRRLPLGLIISVVLAAACSGDAGVAPTSSTTPPMVNTTSTTEPQRTTTTTTESEPCLIDFCVIYTLAEGSMWSDGLPVTSADLVFTHEQGIHASVPVADVMTVDERSAVVRFTEPYGAWQSLFSVVLPAHAGVEASFEVTAGPFVLSNWVPDESITIVRNQMHRSSGELQ